MRNQFSLYHANGKPVDEYSDKNIEVANNGLLDRANKLRLELSQDISLE